MNVLVTGSSTGFGALIVRTLARAGHRVFASMRGVAGRNSAAAEALLDWGKEERVALSVVELDVTSQTSVDAAVASIIESGAQIDAIVNNAGIFGTGAVEAFSIEQVQTIFDVNVWGALRVNRAVLPAMRARGAGLIIHITSTVGRIARGSPYSASKFAMEAFAESLHYELAPFGVDAVILEPGSFPSRLMERRMMPEAGDIQAAYDAARPSRFSAAAQSSAPGRTLRTWPTP